MQIVLIASVLLLCIFFNAYELSKRGAPDLERRAALRDPEAEDELGLFFLSGRNGRSKDHAKAAALFRDAAEQGYPPAQFDFSYMLDIGAGIPLDHVQAANWDQKAAENGYAPAQAILGLWYFRGNGLSRDPSAGVKWLKLAADQSDPKAQLYLGLAYFSGLGVARDIVKGLTFVRIAEQNGNSNAAQQRASMESLMTPEQIAGSTRLLSEWNSKSSTTRPTS